MRLTTIALILWYVIFAKTVADLTSVQYSVSEPTHHTVLDLAPGIYDIRLNGSIIQTPNGEDVWQPTEYGAIVFDTGAGNVSITESGCEVPDMPGPVTVTVAE